MHILLLIFISAILAALASDALGTDNTWTSNEQPKFARRLLQDQLCNGVPTIILFKGLPEPYLPHLAHELPADKLPPLGAGQVVAYNLEQGAPQCLAGQTTYPGNIIVWEEGNLTDSLSCLSGLTMIAGKFILYGRPGRDGDGLTSLSFLRSLQKVGSLEILHLDGLKDLTGLNGLERVDHDLLISDNKGLLTLKGLDSLTAVGEDFLLYSNLNLMSVEGAGALTSVGDEFSVKGNGNLVSLVGLSSLKTIGGKVVIVNNGDTHLGLPPGVVAAGAQMAAVDPSPTGQQNASHGSDNSSADGAGPGYSGRVLVLHGDNVPTVKAVNGLLRKIMPPLAPFSITGANTQMLSLSDPGLPSTLGSNVAAHVIVLDDGSLPSSGLEPLAGVTSIQGQLILLAQPDLRWNSGLASLSGLDALQTTHGLAIIFMKALSSLEGLGSLTEVRGSFIVMGVPRLTSLAGVSALTDISSDLWVESNERLQSLEGLEALESVYYCFHVKDNPRLANFDALTALQKIGSEMLVQENDVLSSTAGLSSLESVGGTISFLWNPKLKDVSGLSQITSVTGDLIIAGHPLLQDLHPLSALKSVSTNLVISNNDALKDLSGLEDLAVIGALLSVSENAVLEKLNGLGSLKKVGGDVYIRDNPRLKTLDGFGAEGLVVGGSLYIDHDWSLADVGGLDSRLASVHGSVALSGGSLSSSAKDALVVKASSSA